MRNVTRVSFTLGLVAGLAWGQAGDEHWSRQFAKPQSATKMHAGTGMSDGGGKPTIKRVRWHDGKLWLAGAW